MKNFININKSNNLKRVNFNKFIQKYLPILNYKKETTVVEGKEKYIGYIFNYTSNKEYIDNKGVNYVWSVVRDLQSEKILLLPGKYREAEVFMITTVPTNNFNIYVNLTEKLNFIR